MTLGEFGSQRVLVRVAVTKPRGLFRREYEGNTFRDNLGLPRPANRFFTNASMVT